MGKPDVGLSTTPALGQARGEVGLDEANIRIMNIKMMLSGFASIKLSKPWAL